MAVAAIIALAVVSVRMFVSDDNPVAALLDYFDLGFCAIFLTDFIRNVIRAPNRRRYLTTWGIFDLLSSIPTSGALRVFRMARLIRILRALRSVRILILVASRNRASAFFVAAISLTMTLFILVCVAVLYVESTAAGSNIRNAEDVLWWAVVTSSTVGYGDNYPITPIGRVLGAILMFVGIGLFATASGSIGGMLVQSFRDQKPTNEIQAELADLRESLHRIERRLVSDDKARPGSPETEKLPKDP